VTPRRQRMLMLSAMVLAVGASVFFALRALHGDLLYYLTPTQVFEGRAPKQGDFRLGGLVVPGSIRRRPGSMTIRFVLTDGHHSIPVVYTGVLPDLFRPGQGVVARGELVGGTFDANEILAKHGPGYHPPGIHSRYNAPHIPYAIPDGPTALASSHP
jgi:cytochrome c-type biogenesis protein CcmE